MQPPGKTGCPRSHLVLIPSYNTGSMLYQTVANARRQWPYVWVVIDGSTDGSEGLLTADSAMERVEILRRVSNGGKGAAVLDGLRAASRQGFTHVLVMDADGQHSASAIPEFMKLSCDNPSAMILGQPVFDETAPLIRVMGRRLSNILTKLEALRPIADSLCGFRVYPLAELMAVMESTPRMRRFDFDPEAVVRLCWRGVPAINRPTKVRYFRPEEGGISHFRYGRDNMLLTAMHARLLIGFLRRLVLIAMRRLRPSRH